MAKGKRAREGQLKNNPTILIHSAGDLGLEPGVGSYCPAVSPLSRAIVRQAIQTVHIATDVNRAMHPTHRVADADALLAEAQAAELLSLSSRTLQAWRLNGSGPSFVRAGRAVRYRRRDLLAWMDANTVSPAPSSSAANW